jgi:hypothetical protein
MLTSLVIILPIAGSGYDCGWDEVMPYCSYLINNL